MQSLWLWPWPWGTGLRLYPRILSSPPVPPPNQGSELGLGNPSSHRRARSRARFRLHRLCMCADCFQRCCQLDTWSIPPSVSPYTIGALAIMLHTLVVMLPFVTGPDEQRIEVPTRPLTTTEGFDFALMLGHVSNRPSTTANPQKSVMSNPDIQLCQSVFLHRLASPGTKDR